MNLFQDFKDLLAEFARFEVKFVLLGGYAVAFYGHPRTTKDIDLLVELSDENRAALAEALAAFGAPTNVVEAAQTLAATQVLYFGVAPKRVDILAGASGIDDFDAVFDNATRTHIDGVQVRVIAIDDLIRNKRAAGRAKDLDDAEKLESLT